MTQLIIPVSEDKKETSKITPVQEPREFGPWAGDEFDFAAKHDILYPLLMTISDVVPFAKFMWPSGRQAFAEQGPGGKVATLALDAAVFVPFGWIGKGLKITAKPAISLMGRLSKKMPFKIKNIADQSKPVLDDLARTVDKYVWKTPIEKATEKWGLQAHETKALFEGKLFRPDGDLISTNPAFTKHFTRAGLIREPTSKLINTWKSSSPAVERLAHQKLEWEKRVGKIIEGGKYEVDDVFFAQAYRLFGDAAKGLTKENIGAKDFSKILMDSLLNEGKILRHMDITSRSYLIPIRKVYGPFEKRFKTLSKIYEPVRAMFGAANASAYMDTAKFHAILVTRGLGKLKKSGRFVETYNKVAWQEAGKLVRRMDVAQAKGLNTQAILDEGSHTVQQLVKSYHEWTNYMYANYMKESVPNLFEKAGATEEGIAGIRALMHPEGGEISSAITATLSAGGNVEYRNAARFIENTFKKIRETVKSSPHWFENPTGARYNNLLKNLSPRRPNTDKGYANYLENYGARIFEKQTPRNFPVKKAGLPGEMEAGWKKTRTQKEAPEATEDLAKMIEARARSQSKELYIYPKIGAVSAEAEKLPTNLKSFTQHYLARMLGNPSSVDIKVARMINRTFGTSWDDRRVMNLAWRINDLIYLGGIGFKPFSAMRNYIQPLLMVPADMGGVKDLRWLVQGYKRAFTKEGREYIKSIGAIAEFTPDLLFRPAITRFGFGAKMRQIRDLAMWMFKCSDRHNRYVSGGAAMEKWEHYFRKFTVKNSKGDYVMFGGGVKKFKEKLNLNSREPWVRSQIDDLLQKGTTESLKEAKKLWIKDVIADTQFLYGTADSPLITQVGGSVTKTAMVFQSWWMNYGSAFGKWALRSEGTNALGVSTATNRMFGWMLSATIAYNIMEPVWGKATATSTVGFGPLPLEADLPASWRPFAEALKLVIEAGSIPITGDANKVKKRMKSVINTSLIYAPGGLFLGPVVKGAAKEGWEGALKGVIKYRGGE